LEIGDWRLEIGDWRLEIGDWMLEVQYRIWPSEMPETESSENIVADHKVDF
jgi:hypothetical protein